MKLKYLFVITFLIFSIETTKAQDLGLMPYIGLSRTATSVDMIGEKETVTGYELGAEYQWIEEDSLKSASRLGLKNVNADTGNIFSSYEIEMNVLTIGQSVSYDYDLGGNILRPFAAVDLGGGLAKAKIDVLGEHAESDSKFVPYASIQTGARYIIDRYAPFVVVGYQYAKVDDVGFDDLSAGGEVDFSGAYVTVGLGMFF